MKLLRLYIRNCGIFQKNTLIDFTHNGKPQNILCLAGVNGSGKTTVMELIFNIFSFINPDLSLEDIFFDRLKPNILTRTNFAQLDIEIEDKVLSLVLGNVADIQKIEQSAQQQAFIVEDEIKTFISQFENTVVKTPEDEEDTTNIMARIKGVQQIEAFSERQINKKNISIFDNLFENIKNSTSSEITENNGNSLLPLIYFFNAHDREILDIRYNTIQKEKEQYPIINRYNPRRDDLKKTLLFYDYAYPDKFEALTAWINEHVLIGKAIDKIDRVNFQVIIKTKDGKSHGLELLSSGEESLLIIATQLYLRASQNSIFLIDEIDQSLHPEFQERVMKLLFQLQKDKGCQIIISSHSEIVWKVFDKGLIDLTEMVLQK